MSCPAVTGEGKGSVHYMKRKRLDGVKEVNMDKSDSSSKKTDVANGQITLPNFDSLDIKKINDIPKGNPDGMAKTSDTSQHITSSSSDSSLGVINFGNISEWDDSEFFFPVVISKENVKSSSSLNSRKKETSLLETFPASEDVKEQKTTNDSKNFGENSCCSRKSEIRFSADNQSKENDLVCKRNLLEVGGDILMKETDEAFKRLGIMNEWVENTEEIKKLLKKDESSFENDTSAAANSNLTWSFKKHGIGSDLFASAKSDTNSVQCMTNMSIGEIIAARTEKLGTFSGGKGRQRAYFGINLSTSQHSISDVSLSNEIEKARASVSSHHEPEITVLQGEKKLDNCSRPLFRFQADVKGSIANDKKKPDIRHKSDDMSHVGSTPGTSSCKRKDSEGKRKTHIIEEKKLSKKTKEKVSVTVLPHQVKGPQKSRSHNVKARNTGLKTMSLSTISEMASEISLEDEHSEIATKFIPDLKKDLLQSKSSTQSEASKKEESVKKKTGKKKKILIPIPISVNDKHKRDIQQSTVLNHCDDSDCPHDSCSEIDLKFLIGEKNMEVFDVLKKNFPFIVKHGQSKDSRIPEVPSISLNCSSCILMPYTTTSSSKDAHLSTNLVPYVISLPDVDMLSYLSSDPRIGVRAPCKIICELTYTGFISKTKVFLHNPADATLYYNFRIISLSFNGVSLPVFHSKKGSVAGVTVPKVVCAHSCATVEAEIVFKPKFKCRGEVMTKIEVLPTLNSNSCENEMTYGAPHFIEMVFPFKWQQVALTHERKLELDFKIPVERNTVIKEFTLFNKDKDISSVNLHIVQPSKKQATLSFDVRSLKISKRGPLLKLKVINPQCIECTLNGRITRKPFPRVNIPVKLRPQKSICEEEFEKFGALVYAVHKSKILCDSLQVSVDIGKSDLRIQAPYQVF